jgi:hypothetical protein
MENNAADQPPSLAQRTNEERLGARGSVESYLNHFPSVTTRRPQEMDDLDLAKHLVDRMTACWAEHQALQQGLQHRVEHQEPQHWVDGAKAAATLIRVGAYQVGLHIGDERFNFDSEVTNHTFERLSALHDEVASHPNVVAMRNLEQWARTPPSADRAPSRAPSESSLEDEPSPGTSYPNQRRTRHSTPSHSRRGRGGPAR